MNNRWTLFDRFDQNQVPLVERSLRALLQIVMLQVAVGSGGHEGSIVPGRFTDDVEMFPRQLNERTRTTTAQRPAPQRTQHLDGFEAVFAEFSMHFFEAACFGYDVDNDH